MSCSGGDDVKIGEYRITVPNGIEVLAPDNSEPGAFDEDHGVRLIFKGTTERLQPIRAFLEPFDPLEGPAVDLIDVEFYHPERIESLDREIFVPSTDVPIGKLLSFKSTGRFPARKYFYPDGRRAAICFLEGPDNRSVCTKTHYYPEIVMEYRFQLDKIRMLEDVDRELSKMLGLPD